MDKEDIKNNSLVKVENNSLKEIGKRAMPKIVDNAKRLGKIVGWGGLTVLGVGAFSIGSVPVATLRSCYFFRIKFKVIKQYFA